MILCTRKPPRAHFVFWTVAISWVIDTQLEVCGPKQNRFVPQIFFFFFTRLSYYIICHATLECVSVCRIFRISENHDKRQDKIKLLKALKTITSKSQIVQNINQNVFLIFFLHECTRHACTSRVTIHSVFNGIVPCFVVMSRFQNEFKRDSFCSVFIE